MVQALSQCISELPVRALLDWSTPPDGFIDGVVAVLKRTGRWNRDGRSLRSVNKLWNQALDAHVESIHPHGHRIIEEDDIFKLLKFPNLTSLDVAPFVRADRTMNGSEALKVLSMLPNLKHVVMDTHVLCLADGRELRGLTGLQSLHVKGTGIPLAALMKLQFPNLVEFKGNLMECEPARCMALMPSLKRLHLGIYTPKSSPVYDHLDVEEVNMVVVGQMTPLTKMSSIVSLEVLLAQSEGFGRLCGFSNLKHLKMVVASPNDLEGMAFDYVVKRLTTLKLQGRQPVYPLPSRFWTKVRNLKSLSLQNFSVDATDVSPMHLPIVESLGLVDCVITTGVVALNALTTLTALEMRINRGMEDKHPQMDLCIASLDRLKALQIQFGQGEGPTSELFSTISGLSNLESLNLECIRAPFSNRLTSMDWEKLNTLPKLSKLSVAGVTVLSVLETIMHSAVARDLDSLHLVFNVWHTRISVLEEIVEKFLKEAPNVKLTTRLSVHV